MKKYFYLLFFIGIIFLATSVNAAPCQYISTSEYHWGIGRITSLNINIGNNNGCPDGWGVDQGAVLFNDVPSDITFWGSTGVSVNVPDSVDGIADIKVIGSDGLEYGTTQLLISLKVDSYPSEITLGDPIEITGNFANTPGSENINSDSWPGRVVNSSVGGYNSHPSLISWTDDRIVISTSDFGFFKVGINTFKVFYGSSNVNNGYQSRSFDINIKAPVCTVNSWQCSNWDSCSLDGIQKRTCEKMGWGNNAGLNYCEGGVPSPATTQTCTPLCVVDNWSCSDWSICSQGGTQTRTCNKTTNCQGGVSSPATSQSCAYIPACISFYYSNWSGCGPDGTQTRNIISKYPYNCEGGELPKTTQSCTYVPACTSAMWTCSDWSTCSTYGTQTRTCTKTINCTGGASAPAISQSCNYVPTCTADTWTCGNWSSCSLSGIQTRSCTKTFDCPNVETAPPITAQYCESPNRPTPQIPPSGTDEILNQDSIIKSTVKLLCPVDAQRASQGSGTVIDPSGTILTNKHVIAGTLGCLVGFINDFSDEPYFGERQIADIFKVSSNQDIAILKIRNPQNRILTSIDITKGTSNLRLGTKITIYGYPAKFGTNITYTSGDFSGTDGNYLKTTAILEYGNSGGGAYLKNGTFIGIPSAVVKGELNALGYILSINTINSWLGNSSIIYGGASNNTYSRVSILEDIDLKKLDSLKLFIPETDAKGDITASATNQEQPQLDQTQEESTVIESTEQDQQVEFEEKKQKSEGLVVKLKSFFQKIFQWIVNLF